jgi:hypothetical protein
MNNFLDRLAQDAYDGLDITDHQVDLSGWMDGFFADEFGKAIGPNTKYVFEVGSWKGLSTITMANICKTLGVYPTIVAIDTWLGAPEFWTWGLDDLTRGISLKKIHGYPTVYHTFIRNVKAMGHNDMIVPFPISSVQAVEVLSYHNILADVIYIDAAHEYEAVYQDITKYWSLLAPGGTMIGDDYIRSNWPGVVRAVDTFCAEQSLEKNVHGVVWSIKKPN